MELRLARFEDIHKIMDIINKAKEHLKSQGIDQWQKGYPNEETIEKDIVKGDFYILLEDDIILGITALSFTRESTYDKIYEGKWLSNGDYAVIHRMATDLESKRKGVASEIINQACKICIDKDVYSIKVDTHRNNLAMQKMLEKNNFIYCGLIYLHDGSERLAFEKILSK